MALGDSFTEGVGDPSPTAPNGWLGWADRVAGALATQTPDFAYANLAIRGRKLRGILAEQVEPAIALQPDLISIHGGGNDLLRPNIDIDALAAAYDEGIGQLAATGAHIMMFTVADPGLNSAIRVIRGRTAIFNEWIREIAETHEATLVDTWRMRDWKVAEVMDIDRLHLNPVGHQNIAIAALDALSIHHHLQPLPIAETPELSRREQRATDIAWARDHLAPWVKRRVTGRSSGDGVSAKYPVLTPLTPVG